MLRFYADKFVGICGYLTQMELIVGAESAPGTVRSSNAWDGIKSDLARAKDLCNDIGLPWTVRQLEKTVQHLSPNWPAESRGLIAECRDRLQEELEEQVFLKLDHGKVSYADQKWLLDTDIETAFPSTITEFQHAGRCYAYDESTACMFHLMRVVDFGLRSVALSLGIIYNNRAWDGLGKAITAKMDDKYQNKAEDWRKVEPMYAEILTDIQAISRGHRNPVLHELEKKYEPKEAQYMLTVVEGFISHLAKNGFKE